MAKERQRKVVFKITFPNGKIFVGKDLDDTIVFFGDVDPQLVAKDLSREQRRDFSVRKEILWESETATPEEVNSVEQAYIRTLGANDPSMVYNQRPKFAPPVAKEPRADPAACAPAQAQTARIDAHAGWLPARARPGCHGRAAIVDGPPGQQALGHFLGETPCAIGYWVKRACMSPNCA
jgi:hypothetical protein